METNGALARRENFEFNFIHDYDVIIIGHACTRARARLLACYRCRRVLNETEREKMEVISKKQIKPKETPLIL